MKKSSARCPSEFIFALSIDSPKLFISLAIKLKSPGLESVII